MNEIFTEFFNNIYEYFIWLYTSFKNLWLNFSTDSKIYFSIMILLLIFTIIESPRVLLLGIIVGVTYFKYMSSKSKKEN